MTTSSPKSATLLPAANAPTPEDCDPLTTRELCLEMILALCRRRDHVYVTEERNDKTVTLTIHCHADDIGQVIGKEGSCLDLMTKFLTRIEWEKHSVIILQVAR